MITSSKYCCVLTVSALLACRTASAQTQSSSSNRAVIESDAGQWTPLGSIPVDQAGAGRRGYALAVEGADVTAPGANHFSIHGVASNNFYREQTNDFFVSERYETHAIALGYRRGFKAGAFPRVEIGGQVQLVESDSGVLNRFIEGFEDFWVSVTGNVSSKNHLRTNSTSPVPGGTIVTRNGRALYQEPGGGSGVGDLYFVVKAALKDGEPFSNSTRIAARIGVNVAGKTQFSQGNFGGIGVSLDKKLTEWAAFHGDLRGTYMFDLESKWSLPLRRAAIGFSLGSEFKLPAHSSFNFQIDGSSTPYWPTGTQALDQGYGDVSFGLAHQFRTGRRSVVAHFYARENMNLPFRVRWNTDPDLAVGLKVTIQ